MEWKGSEAKQQQHDGGEQYFGINTTEAPLLRGERRDVNISVAFN